MLVRRRACSTCGATKGHCGHAVDWANAVCEKHRTGTTVLGGADFCRDCLDEYLKSMGARHAA